MKKSGNVGKALHILPPWLAPVRRPDSKCASQSTGSTQGVFFFLVLLSIAIHTSFLAIFLPSSGTTVQELNN